MNDERVKTPAPLQPASMSTPPGAQQSKQKDKQKIMVGTIQPA
jgi:hypothetical protein